jgi:hypothetical protein
MMSILSFMKDKGMVPRSEGKTVTGNVSIRVLTLSAHS